MQTFKQLENSLTIVKVTARHDRPGSSEVLLISPSAVDDGCFIPAVDMSIMGQRNIKILHDLCSQALSVLEHVPSLQEREILAETRNTYPSWSAKQLGEVLHKGKPELTRFVANSIAEAWLLEGGVK